MEKKMCPFTEEICKFLKTPENVLNDVQSAFKLCMLCLLGKIVIKLEYL